MNNLLERPSVRRLLQLLLDVFVAGGAWSVAFLVRFDGLPPAPLLDEGLVLLPAIVGAKVSLNIAFGHYRQLWQYTGLREVAQIFAIAVVPALALMGARVVAVITIPYGLIVVDWLFYALGLAGLRLLRRVQVTALKRSGQVSPEASDSGSEKRRVLFLGAGDTAESLLRDFGGQESYNWEIVGLLDDDSTKQGTKLHGFPILGPTTEVETFARQLNADRVVIAMPSAPDAVVRDLARRARRTGVHVQRVPALKDLALRTNGESGDRRAVRLSDLRAMSEVQETLLARVPDADDVRPVVVTGGAGYIGSHLVRKLLEEGEHVRVLDNLTYGKKGLKDVWNHPRLEIIEGDVCNIHDVVRSIRDARTVIALAAIVGDPACGLDAEATLNLNYESTKILVEACNFYGVERLVFASSCSVYGASDDDLLTETSPLNPVSLYARTRIMSEEILLQRTKRENDVTPVILRLATVFGLSPRMRFDLVVNTLTVRAVVDGRIEVYGGDQWRPFVHCRDAARAFYAAATAPLTLVEREVFNVGANHLNYTIDQVADAVQARIENVDIEREERVFDKRNYRVSCAKICDTLGFDVRYGLDTGIAEMADAIRTNPSLQNYDADIYSNLRIMEQRLPYGDPLEVPEDDIVDAGAST